MANEHRYSQVGIEAGQASPGEVRTSQAGIEYGEDRGAEALFSQVGIEVGLPATGGPFLATYRFSQVGIEFGIPVPRPVVVPVTADKRGQVNSPSGRGRVNIH